MILLNRRPQCFFHTQKWDYNFLCNFVTWKCFRISNLAFQAKFRSSIDTHNLDFTFVSPARATFHEP